MSAVVRSRTSTTAFPFMSVPPALFSRLASAGVNGTVRQKADIYAVVQQVRDLVSQYLRSGLPMSNFDVAERRPALAADAHRVVEGRAAPSLAGRSSIDDVSAQIDQFALRPIGWDGADGLAPSPAAVRDAHAFCSTMLAIGGVVLPEVHAPGDGEVVFQWRPAGGFTEVAFPGDGTISWSARDASGRVEHGDDAFDHERVVLPAGLRAAMRKMG